jgi:hypothetical protein
VPGLEAPLADHSAAQESLEGIDRDAADRRVRLRHVEEGAVALDQRRRAVLPLNLHVRILVFIERAQSLQLLLHAQRLQQRSPAPHACIGHAAEDLNHPLTAEALDELLHEFG